MFPDHQTSQFYVQEFSTVQRLRYGKIFMAFKIVSRPSSEITRFLLRLWQFCVMYVKITVAQPVNTTAVTVPPNLYSQNLPGKACTN